MIDIKSIKKQKSYIIREEIRMGCINESFIHPEINQLEYNKTNCPTSLTIPIS